MTIAAFSDFGESSAMPRKPRVELERPVIEQWGSGGYLQVGKLSLPVVN
jgi:hypothetical protein